MRDSLPILSIIIPTRDRVTDLRVCLESLAAARVEGMECIVVDDGSAQDVAAALQGLDLVTTLIRNERSQGSGAARNAGAAVAQGEILLFIDDDVCIAPGNLAAVVETFERDAGLGAVMGRYDDSPSSPHFLSRFRNLLHAYTHRVSAGPACTFWTGFGAVRASIFRQYGGFFQRDRSIDDVEFGSRIASAGVRIELRPDLQVTHRKRWTLQSMVKTDLLLRGVPWTVLLWQNRKAPNTLNLRHSSRWSVVFAFAMLFASVAATAGRIPWTVPALCFVPVMLINMKFYVFLRAHGGMLFALSSIPAHWIYLWTAGASFLLGTAIFLTHQLKSETAGTPLRATGKLVPVSNNEEESVLPYA